MLAPLVSPTWPQAQSPALGRTEGVPQEHPPAILQHLIHCQCDQNLGCRLGQGGGDGLAGWAECRQGTGRVWGSGKVQVRCRCGVGRVEWGAGNVQGAGNA